MARGYFSVPISEHLEKTPEGFLIARDTVLARTGWQTYSVRDLPQEAAADMGVDVSNPSAEIDLYRRPEDVFAPDTLKSFEGKPVVDGHPDEGDVNPNNFSELAKGHVQNIRKGSSPLESGDWPLIGDIHIMAEPLLSKVENNLVREVSLGYDYGIEKDGDRICQVNLVGNHSAIVPKGRAGSEARILDAAPEPSESPPELAAISPPETAGMTSNAPPTAKKEHRMKNPFMYILGLGLRARAADAEVDPEELAQAAMDLGKHAAKDDEEDLEALEAANDKKARDRRAKDIDPAIEAPPDKDVEPANDRKAMHDKLDEMMDARDKGVSDADIAELRSLLDEFLGEEADEPEHMEDADPAELEELLGAGEAPDAEDGETCEECGLPGDECACDEEPAGEPGMELDPSGEEDLAPVGDRASAHDAARDGARAVLKMLRPGVARSRDAALKTAFNNALASVNKKSRASDTSYARVAAGTRDHSRAGRDTRVRAADAGGAVNPEQNAKVQEFYNNAFKGGK